MTVSNMGGMPSYGTYVNQQNAGLRAAKLGVAQAKKDAIAAKKTPQSILDYQNLIKTMPSSAFIGQAYDNSMSGLGTEIANLNTGRTANTISNLTQAMAAGLGANSDTAALLGAQAGTYKGADEDILAAAASQFNNAKMNDIKAMTDQRLNATGNLANAQDAFDQRSQAAADKLTQALMSEAQAAPDPLSMSNNYLTFLTNKAAYQKNYGNVGFNSNGSSSNGSSRKFKQDQDKTPGKPVLDASGNPARGKNGEHLFWTKDGKMVEKTV